MGKEQFEIKKESVEEYENITIKEEPIFPNINNRTVVANLQIKSEPIDNVEQDLPINRGENVIIKEEFSETFVKSETLVDTSELYNDQIKNEDPLEVHEGEKLENQDQDLSPNTTENDKFQCSICFKFFVLKATLKRHISQVHEKKQPVQCPFCPTVLNFKHNLKRHIALVHEKSKLFKCEENKPKPFKCSLCDSSLGSRGALKLHIDSVHEKKKPFKCSQCEYRTTQKCHLKAHINSAVHEEKKRLFQCGYCPSRFVTENECIKHVAKIHEKNKQNKCPNCPARFEYGGELKNHLTLVHGGRVFNA